MKVCRVSAITGKVRTKEIPVTRKQMSLIERGLRPIRMTAPQLSKEQINFIEFGFTSLEVEALTTA